MAETAKQALSDLLSQPEGSWTLEEGALAVARLGGRSVDEALCRRELKSLGAVARQVAGHARHPRFLAGALSRTLFEVEGFELHEGDELPEASFLDHALATKIASPTLMAVVLCEVGRRCGARFEGVGLPGKLILRLGREGQVFFFDPQREGQALNLEEIATLVEGATGGRTSLREGHLRPISTAQMLAWLVVSLKGAYWRSRDFSKALEAVELMLTIRPDDPREIRDRGRLLFLLDRFRDAILQLETYLAYNPRGEDADVVRQLLLEARAGLKR